MLKLILTILCMINVLKALDNGLGLTPIMGWLTWQRYRCVTDCVTYPRDCLNEDLIIRTADLMVNDGYLEAGYEYLGIDDCWLEKSRGPYGELVADKTRFPRGMKFIADYIHSKGLKFGLYQDYGTHTCAGYPGIKGHEKEDMEQFAAWEVDYIKLDGCYSELTDYDTGYPLVGKILNETGRPILYSCSWPAYQEGNVPVDYDSIAKYCNIWRNYGDIDDSFSSVVNIMDWFGNNQDRLAKYAAPGAFNDPDMLIIGGFGLSEDQAKVQMSIWAILAAPLLISADLTAMKPEFKHILLNSDVIAVNQDPLAKQGLRIFQNKKTRVEVWKRELVNDELALAFVSRRTDGVPYRFNFNSTVMGLDGVTSYTIIDLFNLESFTTYEAGNTLGVYIPPSSVKFYKFIPIREEDNETI